MLRCAIAKSRQTRQNWPKNALQDRAVARLRPSLRAWRLSAVNRRTLWLVIGVKHGIRQAEIMQGFPFPAFLAWSLDHVIENRWLQLGFSIQQHGVALPIRPRGEPAPWFHVVGEVGAQSDSNSGPSPIARRNAVSISQRRKSIFCLLVHRT
jgi:hypothetical protein